MEPGFSDIVENIKSRAYALVGAGSGRSVFDMGDGNVVKVARNRKGLAQNTVEYQISRSTQSPLFAKVSAVSDDYLLLIMEKANRIRSMSEVFRYLKVHNRYEFSHMDEILDMIRKHDLLMVDLYRPVNWGKIKNRYVIIDYGYTRIVKKRFYSLF